MKMPIQNQNNLVEKTLRLYTMQMEIGLQKLIIMMMKHKKNTLNW